MIIHSQNKEINYYRNYFDNKPLSMKIVKHRYIRIIIFITNNAKYLGLLYYISSLNLLPTNNVKISASSDKIIII